MQGKYSQNGDDRFEVVTVRTMEGIDGVRSIWEEMQVKQERPVINADIDRYLSVVEASDEDIQPHIIIIKESDQPAAMVIGWIRNKCVKCEIARKTLFAPVLKELCVIYGGVIGKNTDDICGFVVRELMNVLASSQADMVSFSYLQTDCQLYKLLRTIPNLLCRGYFPKIEVHWGFTIPESMDHFFQSCSKNRRKISKKYIRRIEQEYPGQVIMKTFSTEDELETAISLASRISANTYQRAFGGGFHDDSRTLALLTVAAKKGWLRIYILFVGNEPCAFRSSLKYGHTYLAELTGYAPEWKDYNVGTILFLKVVESLCGDTEINFYDFSFGGGQHKQWGDLKSWPEASVQIFAPRFFPVFVNFVRSLTLGTSLIVQYLVNKLGIHYFVQRYRRKHVLRKTARARETGATVGGPKKSSLQTADSEQAKS